jgi:3-hydroxyacyl-CoA dehydrogenase
MLWRWSQTDEAKKDPDFAPLKVFDLIGYAKTATSSVEAEPYKFLKSEDKKIMNRNSLLPEARLILENNKDFTPSSECKFKLSGKQVREKMIKILDKLYEEKKIMEHGLEVGKELAFVLSGGSTSLDKEVSEDQLFKLELDSFMKLIETSKTQERIKHTLVTGKPLIN